MTACGSDDSGKTSSGADVVKEGTLTVCSDVPYPPFEDFDKTSELGFKGFDVDIDAIDSKRNLKSTGVYGKDGRIDEAARGQEGMPA